MSDLIMWENEWIKVDYLFVCSQVTVAPVSTRFPAELWTKLIIDRNSVSFSVNTSGFGLHGKEKIKSRRYIYQGSNNLDLKTLRKTIFLGEKDTSTEKVV